MQLKNKTTMFMFLVILMLSDVAIMTNSQFNTASAQLATQQPVSGPLQSDVTVDATIDTIAHLSFRPNPVGMGQTFLVNLWMQPPIHAQRMFIDAFTVTITKPDGTEDVIGPLSSYTGDGTAWFEYVADQVGTWKIKFDFLGMYCPTGRYYNGYIVTNSSGTQFNSSVYYKPSSDGPYEIVVQNEQVASYPSSSLPTDYWTRPVEPINRDWWSILGNWPSTGVVGGGEYWPANTNVYNVYNGGTMNNYYAAYVTAPNSAHVAWKRQFAIGGLIGGSMGQQSVGDTATLIYGHPKIIYAGRAYQTVTKESNGVVQSVWQCYDIRTGEVFWEISGITQPPTFIMYDDGGTTGGDANAQPFTATAYLGYIGSGRLIKYRPFTGEVVGNYSIAPLTTGVFYADPYVLSVQNIGTTANPNYRLIKWTTKGTLANLTVSADTRIVSNISWPFSTLGNCADFETGIAVSTVAVTNPATQVATETRIMAASLTTGQLLWNISSGVNTGQFSAGIALADHGKYATRFNDGYWYCWDLSTGNQLWKSELSSWPWGTFGTYGTTSYGGMIISSNYDCISAIDWDTGKIIWKFEATTNPYETPYTGENGTTVNSWHSVACVADGKIYTFNAEHSPDQPLKRGWKFQCINATNGDGIWNLAATQAGGGDGSRVFQGAIADGYVAFSDAYDGYMYVIGKGKSATTIEGPQTEVTLGQDVIITGAVLDKSPGQPDTPCVSKESMTTQMEYLHMQYPIDGIYHNISITGVSVSLDAVDPNGNYVHIGDVTSDGYSGTFGFTWGPEVSGQYTVTATFMGDDSYGSSFATTYVGVTEAPAASSAPTSVSFDAINSNLSMTVIGGVIAIIIAVAIATLLILRKRP
jgi:outer membrane protein assembly factor BamB